MGKASVSHSTLIHADIGRVYHAFTTSCSLDAWFTQGATVDSRPGDEIHFHWVDWGPEQFTTQDGDPVLETIPPFASFSNGTQILLSMPPPLR